MRLKQLFTEFSYHINPQQSYPILQNRTTPVPNLPVAVRYYRYFRTVEPILEAWMVETTQLGDWTSESCFEIFLFN
ncbi:hypothetical protein SKAU_G00069400 [Synaphobranchus kaupii]|uniref:Uncharacterized protein n=1 Tax=Synaphobranchus kaupii TaxID=118154 RepID=A0A9Q1G6N3_SYNKA|nr:hypothetical protein SKAU_G00069400 [Synaphobranchus kaupii]